MNCIYHQQHVHTKQIFKNHQRLKYKKWKHKLREGGDSALNKMSLENTIPTVYDLIESTLAIFITLVANDCGYEGKTKELIFNLFHPLLFLHHSQASKYNNPNWNQGNEWSL